MSELTVKDASEIRDDILRVISNGLRARGVTTPAVQYGSDYYVTAQAVANELEALYAAAVVAADDAMPDTAGADQLDRWLTAVSLSRRPAGESSGWVTLSSTASTVVLTGIELTDSVGGRYTVSTGGTYANGDMIPIESVATGTAANLAGGTSLSWTTPPAYAAPTALVTSAGLSGGCEAEDDETARARLLTALGGPSNGASWSSVAALAEASHPSIQKAFVYPAANGPATCHVAVVGYASSSTTRSRVVGDVARAAAESAIVGSSHEGYESVITKVADVTADVSFVLTLPEATTAVPAGNGGGWTDGVPWPTVYDAAGTASTQRYCDVTVVTSTTAIRVRACTAPVVGSTIHYVDDATMTLYTSKVLTTTTTVSPSLPGTMGQYTITIDRPLPNVAVGDYIWPGCERAQAYVTALLDIFAGFGPYEKTSAAGVLPRAYRKPRYFDGYPYSLDDRVLRAMVDAGDEVLACAWGHQNGGTTTPGYPASIADAPKIFVPKRMAFYHGAPDQ